MPIWLIFTRCWAGEATIQANKEKLLCACTDLMLKNGYHAVSVDSICEKAQVLKGSFYHYFSSKTDLTLQAMEYRQQELKTISDNIFSPSYPPAERFKRFSQCIYDTQFALQKKLGHVCGSLAVTLGSEMACHDEIRGKAAGHISHYTAYYEQALNDMAMAGDIREDIHVKDIASNLNCYIIGKVTTARIQNSLEPLRDIETGFLNLLRHNNIQ